MQVAIVGAGSSIGKEGAPRELGALFGGNLSKALHLDIVDRQLLIACGAGAGLAAVYQVPFASTLFVLETLGVAWKSKKHCYHSCDNLLVSLLCSPNRW